MKGTYSTPVEVSQPEPARAPQDGAFTFTWEVYGDTKTATIDPADYKVPLVAAALASTWRDVISEMGRDESLLSAGLRDLLRVLGELPFTDEQMARFTIADLRRSHLDLWELRLMDQHRRAKSDTAYRKAVYVFALLRRHADDHPGALHESVLTRLEKEPRLRHHRNDGLPALTEEEARAWRRWAYKKVRRALGDPDHGLSDIDLRCATHVLLSLGTGEPPEVLRTLTIDDLVVTTTPEVEASLSPMAHSERLAYLAEHDLIEQIAVTYTKNRSHESYREVYGRRDHAPFKAFRWAIMLNSEARRESGNPALMLMRNAEGVVRQPPWSTDEYRLDSIAVRNDLPFTGPNYWARMRKVVTTREALADPRAYLTSGRRHSPSVFFGHYTNSTVLRAEAGRLLIDGVSDLFERAVTGPTVVTPSAEQALRSGAHAPGLDDDTARALLNGDLDGPQAGCRDPLHSPFEAEGAACTKSMTGTCFGCPNALITQHHLPAALAIQELADPDRAADPHVWLAHWKPIHEMITNVILPAFSDEDIEAARASAHLTPIDPGTLNDMRGPTSGDGGRTR